MITLKQPLICIHFHCHCRELC